MNSNMFQGSPNNPVEQRPQGKVGGPIAALKQGSAGPVMSDMQVMQSNERKQHQDTYIYEHGYNGDTR